MTAPVSAYCENDSIWSTACSKFCVVVHVHGQDRAEVLRVEHRVGRLARLDHRRSHEVADRVVEWCHRRGSPASTSASPARSPSCACRTRASSMTAPMKFDRSVTSPIVQRLDLGDEVLAHLAPDRLRDVGARRGRALLALVLERAADQRRAQHVGVGRRVRDDEVLAAGLADDARVGAVRRDVLADRAPQVLERRGRAGEVDAGQVRVHQRDVGDRGAMPGEHVDDAGRHPGLLEQLHQEVRRELLRHGRLPEHGVAHQRRRGRAGCRRSP